MCWPDARKFLSIPRQSSKPLLLPHIRRAHEEGGELARNSLQSFLSRWSDKQIIQHLHAFPRIPLGMLHARLRELIHEGANSSLEYIEGPSCDHTPKLMHQQKFSVRMRASVFALTPVAQGLVAGGGPVIVFFLLSGTIILDVVYWTDWLLWHATLPSRHSLLSHVPGFEKYAPRAKQYIPEVTCAFQKKERPFILFPTFLNIICRVPARPVAVTPQTYTYC